MIPILLIAAILYAVWVIAEAFWQDDYERRFGK